MGIYKTIDEDAILESATEMHGHATENVAELSVFDASIDAGWLLNWENKIAEAENTFDDETVLDEIQILNGHVAEAKEVCLSFNRDLKYYAEKAWGTKAARYRAFRFAKMHDIGNSVPRFIIYCGVNLQLANKYAAQLTAQSMPAGLPGNFGAAITDLTAKDTAHELAMMERLVLTEDRTLLFDTVYAYMRLANSAAANVFRKRPEKLKLFDLPTATVKKKEEV